MSKKLLLFPVVFVILGILVFNILGFKREKSPEEINYLGETDTDNNTPTQPLIFYEAETFNKAIIQSKNENHIFTNNISGGIIPHHLFPAFIITDFFYRLTQQQPQTIILIGPNHYEKGAFPVLSSLYSWNTPFGTVQPNHEIIKQLVYRNLIKIDETVLAEEHSVAGIMPFIKFYLPETQVVPIILSNYLKQTETEILATNLKAFLGQNTIIVAAVDFSHYLTSLEAQEKDELTFSTIQNFDYRTLFSLNNDYLDGPPAIATLLQSMQKLGTTNMEVLNHTNSGEILKDNFIETTSYFSIAFY